jgi:hypothetical protein
VQKNLQISPKSVDKKCKREYSWCMHKESDLILKIIFLFKRTTLERLEEFIIYNKD